MTRQIDLTPEQIEMLKDTLDNTCDRGPEGEGWQSKELFALCWIFNQHTVIKVTVTQEEEET